MFNYKNFKEYKITNILTDFINEIHDWDKKFFKTRDKSRYLVAGKSNRTINTDIGLATFNRRIYWDKIEKRYRYFTDEEFNITKRAKMINDLKQEILNNLTENLITKKTYNHIQQEFKHTKFSKTTISKIFKNANIQKIIPEQKHKVLDNQKLNIYVDDAFITCWDENNTKQKYCCRLFSFNLGKKQISKNRNQLLNKTTAFLLYKTGETITQDKVYNFVFETINNNYDIKINDFKDLYWQNPNLVIAGDGALWIRALAKWLGGYYILDKFHAFSYLWKSFIGKRGKKKDSTDWNKYIDTSINFANGNYNQLINILKNNVNKQTFNYFKNNEIGIINQNQDWNIGCSAESTVFHLVKSLKGNGAKAYNSKTFINMLNARVAYLNKQNISF
ncbi:Mbov_0401 family ICE element transposase-like protein [Spiroplasma endosymbiont of Nebria brevicollis]|uniref:Mbov_0401 family ICE element transposase-like protein n=1 Tax=Spiroplasma endosymbiont of Nebria brevicollis TaxID=3066284 RepID=UPI00313E555F